MSDTATSLSTSVPSPRLRPRPAVTAVDRASARAAGRIERADRTDDLLRRAASTDDDLERRRLLSEVVTVNMGVANAIAARYRSRGIPEEDLKQVAYLALVKATQGYDYASGHDFLSYSVPTIRGEIKRHFRDCGWAIRPPRRIQELQSRIATADTDLSFTLGRSPRPSEIAAYLEESVDDITEALASDGCFSPTSLDRPVNDEGGASIGDLLGYDDTGRSAVEARVVLAPVVRRLKERDRRILLLRFFRGWTQAEIAADIGVTQMQVSRLLARILGELREAIEDGADLRPLDA